MTWTLHIQDGEHRILLGEYTTEESAAYARRYANSGLRSADADPDVIVVMEEVKQPLPTEVGSVIVVTNIGIAQVQIRTVAVLRDDWVWGLAQRTPAGQMYLRPEQINEWEPWTP